MLGAKVVAPRAASIARAVSGLVGTQGPKPVTPDEAVRLLRAGDNIYLHMGAATPTKLVDAVTRRAEADPSFSNIYINHLHTEGKASYLKVPNQIRGRAMFMTGNVRDAVNQGVSDHMPVFLSEVSHLIRRGKMPVDVTFLTVSPFDKHGWASLGVSCESSLTAIEKSSRVIVIENPSMPRSHGRGMIHISQVDAIVQDTQPIYAHEVEEAPAGSAPSLPDRIGKHIAERIPDGACLQLGIGEIPNAVLYNLKNHKNLGVHTEMISDGLLPLVESGVVNNSQKKVMPGRITLTFALGSRRLYDFIDNNPMFYFDDCAWTNDCAVIRQNPKQMAINSCIEIDLTGQVCSDSIGTRIYSGFGGQVDFIRGAALSPGGMPIIAVPSVTSRGESRIVNTLKVGAGVVTPRALVQHVCTEWGMVDLWGRSTRERAKLLISIADPRHRESLDKAAHARFGPLTWPVKMQM